MKFFLNFFLRTFDNWFSIGYYFDFSKTLVVEFLKVNYVNNINIFILVTWQICHTTCNTYIDSHNASTTHNTKLLILNQKL